MPFSIVIDVVVFERGGVHADCALAEYLKGAAFPAGGEEEVEELEAPARIAEDGEAAGVWGVGEEEGSEEVDVLAEAGEESGEVGVRRAGGDVGVEGGVEGGVMGQCAEVARDFGDSGEDREGEVGENLEDEFWGESVRAVEAGKGGTVGERESALHDVEVHIRLDFAEVRVTHYWVLR